MTSVEFLGETWHEYVVWQTEDRKALNHINNLMKPIQRDGLGLGLGKPKRFLFWKNCRMLLT